MTSTPVMAIRQDTSFASIHVCARGQSINGSSHTDEQAFQRFAKRHKPAGGTSGIKEQCGDNPILGKNITVDIYGNAEREPFEDFDLVERLRQISAWPDKDDVERPPSGSCADRALKQAFEKGQCETCPPTGFYKSNDGPVPALNTLSRLENAGVVAQYMFLAELTMAAIEDYSTLQFSIGIISEWMETLVEKDIMMRPDQGDQPYIYYTKVTLQEKKEWEQAMLDNNIEKESYWKDALGLTNVEWESNQAVALDDTQQEVFAEKKIINPLPKFPVRLAIKKNVKDEEEGGQVYNDYSVAVLVWRLTVRDHAILEAMHTYCVSMVEATMALKNESAIFADISQGTETHTETFDVRDRESSLGMNIGADREVEKVSGQARDKSVKRGWKIVKVGNSDVQPNLEIEDVVKIIKEEIQRHSYSTQKLEIVFDVSKPRSIFANLTEMFSRQKKIEDQDRRLKAFIGQWVNDMKRSMKFRQEV